MAMEDDDQIEDQLEGGEDEDAEVVVDGEEEIAPAATPEAQAAAQEARKTRRERQQERKRQHEQKIRDDIDAQYRDRMVSTQEQLAAALAKLGESQAASAAALANVGKPPQKSPDERIDEAARALGENPTQAQVKDFLAFQRRINEEVATERAREIVQQELKQFQQSQPKPMPPDVASLFAANPWMQPGSPEVQAVNLEIGRLASTERRNLSDPRVLAATRQQAIAYVGKKYGHVTEDAPARRQANPAVFSGGRGGGAGASAGEGAISDAQITPLIRQMANSDPDFKKIADPEKRARAYLNKVVLPRVPKSARG